MKSRSIMRGFKDKKNIKNKKTRPKKRTGFFKWYGQVLFILGSWILILGT
jgi:hypothetical protein